MVPGEASALAAVAVPLLLGAISWGLLTSKDQAFSNPNIRSCEDELREIAKLTRLLVWYRWLAAVLSAAPWLIVERGSALVVLRCSPRSGDSRTCNNLRFAGNNDDEHRRAHPQVHVECSNDGAP